MYTFEITPYGNIYCSILWCGTAIDICPGKYIHWWNKYHRIEPHYQCTTFAKSCPSLANGYSFSILLIVHKRFSTHNIVYYFKTCHGSCSLLIQHIFIFSCSLLRKHRINIILRYPLYSDVCTMSYIIRLHYIIYVILFLTYIFIIRYF